MSKFKEYIEQIKIEKPLYTVKSSVSAQSSRLKAALNELCQEASEQLGKVD